MFKGCCPCARKSPYALHPVSRKLPPALPWGFNVGQYIIYVVFCSSSFSHPVFLRIVFVWTVFLPTFSCKKNKITSSRKAIAENLGFLSQLAVFLRFCHFYIQTTTTIQPPLILSVLYIDHHHLHHHHHHNPTTTTTATYTEQHQQQQCPEPCVACMHAGTTRTLNHGAEMPTLWNSSLRSPQPLTRNRHRCQVTENRSDPVL